MALTQERKQELVSQFGDNDQDTGSTRVQVALLTERINQAQQAAAQRGEAPSTWRQAPNQTLTVDGLGDFKAKVQSEFNKMIESAATQPAAMAK